MVSSIQKRGLKLAVTAAQQALVEQRLQHVGVRAGDLLRGLEAAGSLGEHAQPPKQRLLVAVKEVVAPGDRRAQRLLPRIHPTSCLEQVEALGEPVEELRRAEYDRARRRKLERQRQVVQPLAQRPQLLRRLQLHADRRCADAKQRLPVRLAHRRDGIDVLARQLQPLPRRHDRRHRRARLHEGADEVGGVRHQVLDVVDEHEQPPTGERPRQIVDRRAVLPLA